MTTPTERALTARYASERCPAKWRCQSGLRVPNRTPEGYLTQAELDADLAAHYWIGCDTTHFPSKEAAFHLDAERAARAEPGRDKELWRIQNYAFVEAGGSYIASVSEEGEARWKPTTRKMALAALSRVADDLRTALEAHGEPQEGKR